MPAASCGGWRKARRPLAARATPVPFQLHRAALMLRAWDGVNPARRVASSPVSFSTGTSSAARDRLEERAGATPTRAHPEACRDMIEGGYLRWLAPPDH
jgi:hypothetical protein